MPVPKVMEIPPNPTVTISLTGLLLVRFVEDPEVRGKYYCDVSIHRTASGHYCTTTVRMKKPEHPPYSIWRRGGHYYGDKDLNIWNPANPGVSIYHSPGEFRRDINPVPENMKRDFRWNPNMEGTLFHAGKTLALKPGDTRPAVQINDGIFHTGWTSADHISVTRTGGNAANLPLYRVASMISANIYLGPNDRIELQWGKGINSTQVYTLDRRGDPDVTYEIMIENDPSLAHPGMAESHFKKYYDVITNVDQEEEFNVVYGSKHGKHTAYKSTPDVPCMTGVLGEGH